MGTVLIVCEQAIFTSARSATGEGYRIVAASKGLRSEEKQKITRCSPSHESLCASAEQESGDVPRSDRRPERSPGPPVLRAIPKPLALAGVSTARSPAPGADAKHPPFKTGSAGGRDPFQPVQRTDSRSAPPASADDMATGAAFYDLPGGRWCIALSRHVGAEHSGRGGQCVHTHNIVVTNEDLAKCAYNPMAFIRALLQLPPDPGKTHQSGVMTTLELQVDPVCPERLSQARAALLPPPARLAALQTLLEEKSLVVDLAKDWLFWAEALLLAVPGPMRCRISFGAGLRFSLGRGHTLHVLRDEKNAVQGKVEAQGIRFVQAASTPGIQRSCWLTFVDRHWSSGDLAGLSRRTSRPFANCTSTARERIAELFTSIDALSTSHIADILNLVVRTFAAPQQGAEGEISREYRDAALLNLRARFAGAGFDQLRQVWPTLVELWRKGGEAAAFAQPLATLILRCAAKSDPVAGAELAIAVAKPPAGVDLNGHEAMLQELLTLLCGLNLDHSKQTADRVAVIVPRWREARPNCPLVAQLGRGVAKCGFKRGLESPKFRNLFWETQP